jgi:hypothetical protein
MFTEEELQLHTHITSALDDIRFFDVKIFVKHKIQLFLARAVLLFCSIWILSAINYIKAIVVRNITKKKLL